MGGLVRWTCEAQAEQWRTVRMCSPRRAGSWGVTGDFWQRVETCWRGAECLPSLAPARRHAHAGLFNYVVAWARL